MRVSLWLNTQELDKDYVDRMFNVFYIDKKYITDRMLNYLHIDLSEEPCKTVDRILNKLRDKYAPKSFREACVKEFEENNSINIFKVGKQTNGFWEERVVELLEKGINRGVVIGVQGFDINEIINLCNKRNIIAETVGSVCIEENIMKFKQIGGVE